jgi:hypothetical protein
MYINKYEYHSLFQCSFKNKEMKIKVTRTHTIELLQNYIYIYIYIYIYYVSLFNNMNILDICMYLRKLKNSFAFSDL